MVRSPCYSNHTQGYDDFDAAFVSLCLPGLLMHQGKFIGAWKKAWFVLDGAYLYQYESAKSKRPKKAFYVSYAMAERVGAEALAKEAKARYMTKLEEKACSLRINVYTPGKVKVLTAPSEETMNEWLAAFDKSVAESTADEASLEKKRAAAEKIKPLLMMQVHVHDACAW